MVDEREITIHKRKEDDAVRPVWDQGASSRSVSVVLTIPLTLALGLTPDLSTLSGGSLPLPHRGGQHKPPSR